MFCRAMEIGLLGSRITYALFKAALFIGLPNSPLNRKPDVCHDKAKSADRNAKQKMKDYTDNRRHAIPSKLRTGDTVLVQQNNKISSPLRLILSLTK